MIQRPDGACQNTWDRVVPVADRFEDGIAVVFGPGASLVIGIGEALAEGFSLGFPAGASGRGVIATKAGSFPD